TEPRNERLGHGSDRRGILHRTLLVRDTELERPEDRMQTELPPPRLGRLECPRRRAPAEHLGVRIPAWDCRRNALTRQQLADLRPHGRESGVAALVEGSVGG